MVNGFPGFSLKSLILASSITSQLSPASFVLYNPWLVATQTMFEFEGSIKISLEPL